jgi:serine/threonine protein kinase
VNSPDSQEGPKQLGDFEIVRELGRGGMGVVYEARQRSLNRQVALKVLSVGLGLTTKAIMRFKREAEAAAKLHHTNIVPIYFTGAEDRIPYYAMELVDGPSLDKVIRHLRGRSGAGSNSSLDSADETDRQQQSAVPDWAQGTIFFEKP